MKLLAIGWDRRIATRKVFDLNLPEAKEQQGYSWNTVQFQRIKSVEEMRYWSDVGVGDSGLPSLGYQFRLHVGEKTMGGDYAADLLVSSNDVLAMFKQAFGHLSVDQLLVLLQDTQSAA